MYFLTSVQQIHLSPLSVTKVDHCFDKISSKKRHLIRLDEMETPTTLRLMPRQLAARIPCSVATDKDNGSIFKHMDTRSSPARQITFKPPLACHLGRILEVPCAPLHFANVDSVHGIPAHGPRCQKNWGRPLNHKAWPAPPLHCEKRNNPPSSLHREKRGNVAIEPPSARQTINCPTQPLVQCRLPQHQAAGHRILR